LATTMVVAWLVGLVYARSPQVLRLALVERCREHYTGMVIGRWAEAHLPPDSKILFDDIAYFDPQQMPNAKMHGGLMTYSALEQQRPDYFIICSSIYEAPYYAELRQTQTNRRGQEGDFSVLLYQDLLDRDACPEAELVRIVLPNLPNSPG